MKTVYKLVALWEDCYLITCEGDNDAALVTDLTLERLAFLSLSLVYSHHPEDHSDMTKSP